MQNPRPSDYCLRAATTSPTNAAGNRTEARPKRCAAKAETAQPAAFCAPLSSFPDRGMTQRARNVKVTGGLLGRRGIDALFFRV